METNKIMVVNSPVSRFQKIYVVKDGAMVDQLGVGIDDLVEVLFALVEKYGIEEIDLGGNLEFTSKIANSIKQNISQYNIHNLIVNQIEQF